MIASDPKSSEVKKRIRNNIPLSNSSLLLAKTQWGWKGNIPSAINGFKIII